MNTKRYIYLLLPLLLSTGVSAQITEQSPVITASADSLKHAKGSLPVYSTSAETYMQIMNYSWHIRGGLLGINLNGSASPVPNSTEKDLFSYKLEYETAGQWSGSIGKQTWNHVSGTTPVGLRSYTFTYDGLSRLKTAAYSGQGSESYGIPNINYDRNGNITQLQRNGKTGGSFGLMDNLTYTYSGNRLTAVNDAVSGNYEVDFVKRGSGGYTYYANGALKTDENEEITNIVYNTYLNLPEEITLTGGRWIKYTYDGEGKLLKTEYSTGEYWEYVDEFVFKNGQPYQVAIPDGRATYASGNWVKEFDYKDHLGNTRVSFKEGSTGVVQTAKTDFDPWGVRLNGTGVVNSFQNRWELQGHEKESTFNLNRINFGARVYNPTIGRWDNVDPMAEQASEYTPYRFAFNNPLLYIDPNGMFESRSEARRYAEENDIETGWLRRNKIVKNEDGSFSINNRRESTSIANDKDFGVMTAALVTGKREGPTSSDIWSQAMDPTSDANIIGVGFDFAFLGGAGYQYQAVRINRGDDAGWHFYHTTNADIGFGLSVGLEVSNVNFNYQNPEGLPLTSDTFEGKGNNFVGGIGAASASYGFATSPGRFTMNPLTKNKMYTTKGGAVSLGAGGAIGGMWQGSKTKLRNR